VPRRRRSRLGSRRSHPHQGYEARLAPERAEPREGGRETILQQLEGNWRREPLHHLVRSPRTVRPLLRAPSHDYARRRRPSPARRDLIGAVDRHVQVPAPLNHGTTEPRSPAREPSARLPVSSLRSAIRVAARQAQATDTRLSSRYRAPRSSRSRPFRRRPRQRFFLLDPARCVHVFRSRQAGPTRWAGIAGGPIASSGSGTGRIRRTPLHGSNGEAIAPTRATGIAVRAPQCSY
jgi:hypothetical protein